MAIRQTSAGTGRGPRRGQGSRGGGGQLAQHHVRQQWVNQALTSLTNALIQGGQAPMAAHAYARTLLHNPNVKIGKAGQIFYKDQPFAAEQFAASPLARLVTGQTSLEQNKNAILGESGYLQDIANAKLQQQFDTAGLEDQRRQALIDYGDPAFVAGDPTLSAQAAANPFSVTAALARARAIQTSQVNQAANRFGTFTGGGLQSGLASVGRTADQNSADAVRSITDLLSGVNQRTSQANQSFALAQNMAYQNASQRLAASGALRAASYAPTWATSGGYQYRRRRPPVRQGTGTHAPAGGGAPPPPPAPRIY